MLCAETADRPFAVALFACFCGGLAAGSVMALCVALHASAPISSQRPSALARIAQGLLIFSPQTAFAVAQVAPREDALADTTTGTQFAGNFFARDSLIGALRITKETFGQVAANQEPPVAAEGTVYFAAAARLATAPKAAGEFSGNLDAITITVFAVSLRFT